MRTANVLVLLLVVPGSVLACLWDHDTLQMERQRFPEVLELITGKFLRHSKEFYEWRIENRLKRIEQEPENAALYDDLAVAYDKTGQQDKAIETILKVEKFAPGRYETQANLGTFYIHSGRFEEGLKHIEQAIEIDPDAHFGREVYQKLLVEYVIWKRENESSPEPQVKLIGYDRLWAEGFAYFVLKKHGLVKETDDVHSEPTDIPKAQEVVRQAIKGVSGMMRFGHHDSPVLLEALADLLRAPGHPDDGGQLAARAVLQASYQTKDDDRKELLREQIKLVLQNQTGKKSGTKAISLQELETRFRKERAEADVWYNQVRQDELDWIAAGKDVDAEFDRKYYSEPKLAEARSAAPPTSRWSLQRIGISVFATAIALIAILIVLRQKHGPTAAESQQP